MTFTKNLVFLGITSSDFTGEDGKKHTLYKMSFFDSNSVSPLQINVLENPQRMNMIDLLLRSELGDSVTVTFVLRPSDKLYKLQIYDVSL